MRNKGMIFLFLLLMAVAPIFTGNEKSQNIYVVPIPADKLPWPHQRPDMTQVEYEEMINNLYIINNFGLYAASENLSEVYLHDALDIALPNGTELYSVESGYVKAVLQDRPGYGAIVIGDTEDDRSGVGWMYVHTNKFQFQVGDHVNQGDYIANVFFIGTPHVHFGQIFADSGSWEDIDNWNSLHPDRYFDYIDTEPPTIVTPFYYFKNNTDIMIQNTGSPLIVSGDVDIVVPMRDGGEIAHSKPDGFGDRLCVARIEYSISGSSAVPVYKNSFDFTKTILTWADEKVRDRALVVNKHYKLFFSQLPSDFSNKTLSYYIITNTPGTAIQNDPKFIDCSDNGFAWNTAEKDELGNPRFPDGVYTITVTAYDSIGNRSTVSDIVRVRNTGKKLHIPR
jgi:murein DD-endopeptidase MepM/ murein hydrolase activator NlpD